MVGYTREELLRGAWQALTHSDDMEISRESLARFLRDGAETVEFEKRYIHKNGNPILVRLKISVVRDAHGAPSRFITHVDDVTVRRIAATGAAGERGEVPNADREHTRCGVGC
jgi:PAS domain S-box-containing protein